MIHNIFKIKFRKRYKMQKCRILYLNGNFADDVENQVIEKKGIMQISHRLERSQ